MDGLWNLLILPLMKVHACYLFYHLLLPFTLVPISLNHDDLRRSARSYTKFESSISYNFPSRGLNYFFHLKSIEMNEWYGSTGGYTALCWFTLRTTSHQYSTCQRNTLLGNTRKYQHTWKLRPLAMWTNGAIASPSSKITMPSAGNDVAFTW